MLWLPVELRFELRLASDLPYGGNHVYFAAGSGGYVTATVYPCQPYVCVSYDAGDYLASTGAAEVSPYLATAMSSSFSRGEGEGEAEPSSRADGR